MLPSSQTNHPLSQITTKLLLLLLLLYCGWQILRSIGNNVSPAFSIYNLCRYGNLFKKITNKWEMTSITIREFSYTSVILFCMTYMGLLICSHYWFKFITKFPIPKLLLGQITNYIAFDKLQFFFILLVLGIDIEMRADDQVHSLDQYLG